MHITPTLIKKRENGKYLLIIFDDNTKSTPSRGADINWGIEGFSIVLFQGSYLIFITTLNFHNYVVWFYSIFIK